VSVPVLTAVTDAVREADLVSAFERTDYGVSVVRRCVDLADLLSTAAGGTARAVICPPICAGSTATRSPAWRRRASRSSRWSTPPTTTPSGGCGSWVSDTC
jgi:hypothetical protein